MPDTSPATGSTPAPPDRPIRFHRFALSGHSHRVELFLSLLGLPFLPLDVDLEGGEHKSAAFLAMNPFGQIPVIEDGPHVVADSNAILVYLNARYAPDPERWLPQAPERGAAVQRWLSVAAGPLAYGPAAARIAVLFGSPLPVGDAVARSHALLAVVERTLQDAPFLAGASATLADIANYSYLARAPEGGVALDACPNVRAWLARVEALPGFVPMPRVAM